MILVFTNHLFDWPSGGFIGVDVFFVLSGFLITQLLLREHESTGRISFTAFYKRRAKRILPAATIVVLVTLAVGNALFTSSRFTSLATDGLWATLFSANWRFIQVGTDYMHAADAISPLQHYWSLSVEEQFYFVWPLLLVAVLGSRLARRRRGAAIAIGLVGLLSFGFAMWQTAAYPTSAYFSTFTRAWELAAGAALAICAHRIPILPPVARYGLAWLGLGGVIVSALVLTEDTPFPAPFALAPVLCTLAILAAGMGATPLNLWPLTNRVATYLGDISYSLYLWHFPVIIFSTMLIGGAPRRLVLVATVVTLLLSIASYHFIENPFRRGKGFKRVLRPALAGATILIVAVLSVGVITPAPALPPVVAPASFVVREGNERSALQTWKQIDEAAAATTWPDLSPSIDSIGTTDMAPEWIVDKCLELDSDSLDQRTVTARGCQYGPQDASKTAVVLGDSVAISWLPGVRAALEPEGYTVRVLTSEQCPVAAVNVNRDDGSPLSGCPEFRDWALSEIEDIHPDLVIASQSVSSGWRLSEATTEDAATRDWIRGITETLKSLKASAERVVLLEGPPYGAGFDQCAGKGSVPADCLLTPAGPYIFMHDVEAAGSEASGVEYIPTSSWFCSLEGVCPSFVGTTPVLVDGFHLTAERSAEFAPLLAAILTN